MFLYVLNYPFKVPNETAEMLKITKRAKIDYSIKIWS